MLLMPDVHSVQLDVVLLRLISGAESINQLPTGLGRSDLCMLVL